jgi:hypothetical protein
MLRTDTGNFNRFLTSLGLLLLLGALLVPYFFFHDTDTLRIPAKELGELTPVAREALETRQRREQDLEVAVLVFAGALAAGGIAALWFGGRRLRVAQGKEDAEIDRKAKRDDLEFQQMSQSEVDEKREEQVRESVKDEESGNAEARPAGHGAPPPPPPGEPTSRIEDSRVAFERVESSTKEALEGGRFASHDFLYEVKTSRGSQQLQLDGIFRSTSRDGTDVLLELKVVRQTRMIRFRMRRASDELLALLMRYQHMSRRSAEGWLVVIVPREVEPPDIEERRRLEDQFNQSLAGSGKTTVLHESELTNLASRFRELFESQAK